MAPIITTNYEFGWLAGRGSRSGGRPVERSDESGRLTGYAPRALVSLSRIRRRNGALGHVLGQKEADGAKSIDSLPRMILLGIVRLVRGIEGESVSLAEVGAVLLIAPRAAMPVERVYGDRKDNKPGCQSESESPA